MNDAVAELVKYRLDKAKKTLSDAKSLKNIGSFNSSVNRIYYAYFYAVTALLLCKKFSSSKHSGVKALFEKEFIKTSIIGKEYGKFYSEIMNCRHESDYDDFVEFEDKEVDSWINRAEDFVNKIGIIVLNFINK